MSLAGTSLRESPLQLYVFGSNGEGQLGIPVAEIVNTPTRISDLTPLSYSKSVDELKTIKGGGGDEVDPNKKGGNGNG